jgi:transcription elongation factor SPT5
MTYCFFFPAIFRAAGGEEFLQIGVNDSQLGETFDFFKKDRFKDGLLYKAMNIKGLDIVNASPTLDEMKRFQERQVDEPFEGTSSQVASVSSAIIKSRQKRKVLFSKGDTVEVVEGALKSLTGVVEVIQDNNVWVMPDLDDLKHLLKFEASQLRKYFKEGDHVKVISGRYQNETGLIIKVDRDVVVIFSDLTNQEVILFFI